MTYFLLFVIACLNDTLLTRYYIEATLGHRYKCMLLVACQQVVSGTSMWFTIVDVKFGSREQLIRWVVVAMGYVIAPLWSVRPEKPSK